MVKLTFSKLKNIAKIKGFKVQFRQGQYCCSYEKCRGVYFTQLLEAINFMEDVNVETYIEQNKLQEVKSSVPSSSYSSYAEYEQEDNIWYFGRNMFRSDD